MYAHLYQSNRGGHTGSGLDPAGVGTEAASQPGPIGSITFRQLAGAAEARLTLWDTQASAAAFLRRTAGLAALPAEIYQVTGTGEGPAAARAPAFARLMYFDGPRAPEIAAAADRAGRERIWPAISSLNGLVGVFVLRRSDLGAVVITLATSVEALDAAARAALSTDLLPGEDPALLPGPDRIEIHHVTGYHLPAARLAAS
jgi:hypothetical protein